MERLGRGARAARSTVRASSRSAAALVSFALDGMHPHDVAEILGRQGVCVRAGHHCAQPLMKRLGVRCHVARLASPMHNTREDVDRLVEGLGPVREMFA